MTIYIVRAHNDFNKIRDINLGAFSSLTRACKAMQNHLLDEGFFYEAQQMSIPDPGEFGIGMFCNGLELSSVRYNVSKVPGAVFFEVKFMELDDERMEEAI